MDNLENTPETVETPEIAPTKEPTLAELLASEETSETGVDNGEAVETQTKAKPNNLKSIAETLEMEDKDLYAIEIPMANGESHTLGELKDLVAQQDDLSLRETQFEESKLEKEAAFRRTQQELKQLIAQLPKDALKPEVLASMREKHEAQLKVERQLTLEAIPEWNDEVKRTTELTGIVEHLDAYGFPKEYLSSINDHRTLKYIRDNYLREQRIKKALAQVKKGSPSKTATSKPSAKPPKKAGTSTPKNSRNPLADFLA